MSPGCPDRTTPMARGGGSRSVGCERRASGSRAATAWGAMRESPPRVTVREAARRALRRRRHPWIYRDQLQDLPPGLPSGVLVTVGSARGEVLGHGLYSAHSRIAIRIVSWGAQAPDPDWWRRRLERALAYRRRVVQNTTAYRVVFGEADGLPGLVVDLYDRHLVVQALTAAAQAWMAEAVDLLWRPLELLSALARNDGAVRLQEGLPREVHPLRGDPPRAVEVCEDGVRYLVDPWEGQKTGAFLDQRENRCAVRAYARGRVLDVFCYEGGFALHAAAGATEVIGVDTSHRALQRAEANARLNGYEHVRFLEANAFHDLRARAARGEQFDLVILDPPAFAKRREDLAAARRGYKEINLQALRLLAPGGTLVSCSCSYNLTETAFAELVAEAARDLGLELRCIERRGQARDHPARLDLPETRYLKCLVLAS